MSESLKDKLIKDMPSTELYAEVLNLKQRLNEVLVVLDDDPTGTQTVHDVEVVTNWDQKTLTSAFESGLDMFFILTNSRAFSAEKTKEVHKIIAERILEASKQTGRDFTIISRGDSTLRGHFPLETDVLAKNSGASKSVCVLAPAFFEGKRFTIDDIHYLMQGDNLVEVAQTEFAKDASFGYSTSNLIDYVHEKAEDSRAVESISLDVLRFQSAELTQFLMDTGANDTVVLNATCYQDLYTFAKSYYEARLLGKKFIFRSAASLPKTLGAISEKPYLTREQMCEDSAAGGLIVVGSHVKLSTSQIEELKNRIPSITSFEFSINEIVDAANKNLRQCAALKEAKRLARETDTHIVKGESVLIATPRKLVAPTPMSSEEKLDLSVAISNGLTHVVSYLSERPRYLIAKGGITSSDVATKGLEIVHANVLGQASAGIPVWQAQEESKFPGLPYIIFPGNVGNKNTLADIVEELEQ